MKLHAIEVCNLNSLYGTQVVNLDDDLGEASLFLIRGPTGAGKSTLMDAVSLALFATTPRLGHLRSSGAVAEQIMSRGTGESAAQVEFSKLDSESNQRVRYRARWAARRSRNKPDGNMQAVQRSMERLEPSGEWKVIVADHRDKFTSPVFDEVLEGFSPSDFQRSMLLAQGQFDAMLHASAAERASILERLTDTSDYQRIGELAFRVNKAWGSRIGRLKIAVDAISPVSEEELVAAREAAGAGAEKLVQLDAQLRGVEAKQRWLESSARLAQQAQVLAQAKVAHAEQEQAASPQLEALAESERCRPGLELLDEERGAVGRREKAEQRLAATVASLPELETAAEEQRKAVEVANQRHQAAALGLSQLREPAQVARDVGRRLLEARQELEAARRRLELSTKRAESASKAQSEAQALTAERAEALQRSNQHRVKLAGHEALADVLPTLERRATALATQRDAAARERAGIAEAREEAAAAKAALEQRQGRHAVAEASEVAPRRDEKVAAEEELQRLVGEAEPDQALQELHEEALAEQERGVRLRAAAEALQRRSEAEGGLHKAESREAEAQASHQASVSLLHALEQQREVAASEEAAAEKALVPWERVARYAEERQALVEGEECPLCGSTEHPHGGQAQAVAREVELARQAVTSAKQALASLDVQLREASAALATTAARLEGATQAVVDARSVLQQRVEQAAQRLTACGLSSEAEVHEVDAAEQALAASRATREQRAQALKAAIRRARVASEALEAAERSLRAEAEALVTERARCAQLDVAIGQREVRLEAQEEQLDDTAATLLADLRDAGAVGMALEQALAGARSAVAAWTRAVEAEQGAQRELERAQAALHTATEGASSARSVMQEHTVEKQEREAKVEGLVAEQVTAHDALAQVWAAVRSLPLAAAQERVAGASPGELVAEQDAEAQALEQALGKARSALDASSKAHAEAQARRQEQEQQRAELQRECASLGERVLSALESLGLASREALEGRRLEPEALRVAKQLSERLVSARAALKEREEGQERELERLSQSRPADLSDEATASSLAEEHAEVSAVRASLQEQVQSARSIVDHADRQASALAKAEGALSEARGKARVWQELSRLIGTNKGEAFKQFAQALNLDQLLLRANRHLGTLTPRYQLHTIKADDTGLPTLEFEVADTWRPGTTRSLKTLSGGESFLVSLALALGLSDLRTRSMPVETLLLDEGFGTLDPETLNVALAALQQLQQSGRQVGIISHVVGLDERIPARILVEPVGDGRSRVRAENAEGELI